MLQFEDLQNISPKIIQDYEHLTVTNKGSFLHQKKFSFFWYIIQNFRKPNQELLYQNAFWCGLVLNGLTHWQNTLMSLFSDLNYHSD